MNLYQALTIADAVLKDIYNLGNRPDLVKILAKAREEIASKLMDTYEKGYTHGFASGVAGLLPKFSSNVELKVDYIIDSSHQAHAKARNKK